MSDEIKINLLKSKSWKERGYHRYTVTYAIEWYDDISDRWCTTAISMMRPQDNYSNLQEQLDRWKSENKTTTYRVVRIERTVVEHIDRDVIRNADGDLVVEESRVL